MTRLHETLRRLEEIDPHSIIAIEDIAAERLRQVEREGWTIAHDDAHETGVMARAAACYAIAPHTHQNAPNMHKRPPVLAVGTAPGYEQLWPWDREWWKPKSLHRNRVRAAALLIAELARWHRTAPTDART